MCFSASWGLCTYNGSHHAVSLIIAISPQAYLFFFDKLNKSNYYLELSIQHSDLPIDDRLITHLAGDLISDGGQWDMVVNLLEVRPLLPNTSTY